MGILELLASRNFIAVNKTLIKQLGLEEAIMIGELASEMSYWEEKKQLDEDGYFYSTVENIEEHTTFKEWRQRNVLNRLKDKGLISIRVKGLPAKRYIRINTEEIARITLTKFLENHGTSSLNFAELEPCISRGNNNIINKNIEIKNIIDHLNAVTGSKYRYQSKATVSHIQSRLKEGYTVEDFKMVIDKKAKEWKGTPYEQYLRPETLFGTKFESYLNAKIISKESQQAVIGGSQIERRNYSSAQLNSLFTNLGDEE